MRKYRKRVKGPCGRAVAAKRYYQRNKKKILAYNKSWRQKNAEKLTNQCKTRALAKKYGITLGVYEGLFEAQNGRCAICFQPEILAVDHDHETGRIRGLLCRGCNTALGFVQDSPRRLRAAADYLERFIQ